MIGRVVIAEDWRERLDTLQYRAEGKAIDDRPISAKELAGKTRILIEDLAMIVRRLAYKLPKTDDTREKALEFIARNGLQGSILRTKGAEAK